MKCLRRYLSLLCCLLLLFSICCVPASAETIESKPHKITSWYQVCNDWNCTRNTEYTFYPGDGSQESATYEQTNYAVPNTTLNYSIQSHWTIEHVDGSPLFSGGLYTDFKLNKAMFKFLLQHTGGVDADYITLISSSRALITYIDGTQEYIDDLGITNYSHSIPGSKNVRIKFTPKDDVVSVELIITQKGKTANSNGHWFLTFYNGEQLSDDMFSLKIDQKTKEETLAEDTNQTVKDGFDSIGEWFAELGESITGVFDAIIELPAKIWEFVQNGIMDLFVPDEQYIVEYKDKWDLLLSERLGAVYQVTQLISDVWADIGTADTTNTIYLPSVSIPLGDTSFTFGGYDVKIVPDGFEIVVDALKAMVGIACTIMFVNGLRKRYEEIMR